MPWYTLGPLSDRASLWDANQGRDEGEASEMPTMQNSRRTLSPAGQPLVPVLLEPFGTNIRKHLSKLRRKSLCLWLPRSPTESHRGQRTG